MAWTTPRTWVAGEKPTAATLNTHIRDNFNAIGDAWSSYTPTMTATTTNPTIGNGTLNGYYIQVGKLVMYRIEFTYGSTSTAGTGFWRWAAPVQIKAPITTLVPLGTALVYDVSAGNRYMRHAGYASNLTILLCDDTGTQAAHNAPIATPATGDCWVISGFYEAA